MSFEPETAPVEDTNPTLPLTDAPAVAQQDLPFRLLKDETVLGTFPIAQKKRPLGKLASFLFVTDSRVIYAAEAKSITSTSTDLKEYQVQTVNGIQVSRHRGLDSLGLTVAVGSVLNFILWLSLGGFLASAVTSFGQNLGGGYGGYDGGAAATIAWPFVVLAIGSLVFGTIAVLLLIHNVGEINIVGPQEERNLAKKFDWIRLFVVILLFILFGIFIAFALIGWAIIRELGVFSATDASTYADTKNLDNISYEAGALILDVQARGKLAGR